MVEQILIKDANGTNRAISVDEAPAGVFTQLQKVAFGASGAAPTMVSPADPLPVVLPAAQRTPGLVRVSNNSVVTAGARRVSIANVGAVAGTLLGATLQPGEVVTYEATAGETLGAIAYNATGTEFLIAEVR